MGLSPYLCRCALPIISLYGPLQQGKKQGKPMARAINRLNTRKIATTKPGRHSDGGNLFLSVSRSGARSWVFKYQRGGKTRELGLGSARDVPLARARQLAAAHRSCLAEGRNPAAERRSGTLTFGEMSDRVIADLRPSWRNRRHAAHWEMTLTRYAAPLRRLPIEVVDTNHVLDVLKPLWGGRLATAKRLRARIERVLDAAKALGFRAAENPARWRGHLDHLLPLPPRQERRHHTATPYEDVPALVAHLQGMIGVRPRALEFTILTACRTSEVLGARHSEFDLANRLWTVPAARMKGGRPHVVPLSDRAAEIVTSMLRTGGDFVFAGRKPGTRLSDTMMLHCLQQTLQVGATVHGFRSSFRDWAGDCTDHPRDVVEAALAHAVENRTEAAYRRMTALAKRRELMNAWSEFCLSPPTAKILPLRA
jgi:integrase